jgi:PRTRC genetic system protein B
MIVEETILPFDPVQAIIVYKKGSDYYLESHAILKDGDKYKWTEGKPLTSDSLIGVAKALGEKQFEPMQSKGVLPDNLIYLKQEYANTTLMWFIPSQKRMLHFNKQLKLKSGTIVCPPMLFAVVKKNLYVFALEKNTRPTEKSKLYKAPFFNQYEDGEVCMGNTTEAKRLPTIQEEMKRWERRYFGSEFTHLIDTNVVQKKYNLSVILKRNVGTNQVFFKDAFVLSKYKTVNGFINSITK